MALLGKRKAAEKPATVKKQKTEEKKTSLIEKGTNTLKFTIALLTVAKLVTELMDKQEAARLDAQEAAILERRFPKSPDDNDDDDFAARLAALMPK